MIQRLRNQAAVAAENLQAQAFFFHLQTPQDFLGISNSEFKQVCLWKMWTKWGIWGKGVLQHVLLYLSKEE